MKLNNILNEDPPFKSEQWSEGYDGYWNGKHPNDCPYKEENKKAQWLSGWNHANKEED